MKPRDGGDVGVGELLAELRDARGAGGLRVGGLVDLALVEDVDRPFRPHHRDLGAGHAKFTSVRMCLLDITQYAPP